MKISKLILAVAAGLMLAYGSSTLLAADASKEVTITGNMVCGKCTLHETEKCQNVVQVTTDGQTLSFDTPRCALDEWKNGKAAGKTLRVQEYYDRTWRDASTVRFLVGGDVTGPMGPDLVPVDPAHATKFIQDHAAERALTLDEITPAVLAGLK